MPRLSIVIPHWPLDAETDDALRRCVASFPPECERIVVVNDGTGFARNANIGLRLASGDVGARPPYRGPQTVKLSEHRRWLDENDHAVRPTRGAARRRRV